MVINANPLDRPVSLSSVKIILEYLKIPAAKTLISKTHQQYELLLLFRIQQKYLRDPALGSRQSNSNSVGWVYMIFIFLLNKHCKSNLQRRASKFVLHLK